MRWSYFFVVLATTASARRTSGVDAEESKLKEVLRSIGKSTLSVASSARDATEQLRLQERLRSATDALQARLKVVYGGPDGLKPKVQARLEALLQTADKTLIRVREDGKVLAKDTRRRAETTFNDFVDVLNEALPEEAQPWAEQVAQAARVTYY